VLYEFDGPRIFTLRDVDGSLHLACWSDEDDDTNRFVVSLTTAETIDSLRRGALAVYDALHHSPCYLCDVTDQGVVVDCQLVDFQNLPVDTLPAPGTKLLADFRLPPQ
jgi:hypothetical protein